MRYAGPQVGLLPIYRKSGVDNDRMAISLPITLPLLAGTIAVILWVRVRNAHLQLVEACMQRSNAWQMIGGLLPTCWQQQQTCAVPVLAIVLCRGLVPDLLMS
jgi:hypothetical protein